MDPLQKSLGQKGLYQGVALATLFCATKSSRLVSYLPNFSKNGLLLLEGTLITSSFLHDIYRRQHPEHSYPIEKGILMGVSALAASYVIAKCSEALSPQLVLTATTMTFLFSLGVSKISALSPIEVDHYTYCKNPQALSALKEEERVEFAKKSLAAGLPFVPGLVGYQEKMQGVFPKDEIGKMYATPQNYSKNHLSWFLGLTKAPFKEQHAGFMKYVIENRIPIFDLEEEETFCYCGEGQLGDAAYQLYTEYPVYASAGKNQKIWLKEKDPLPGINWNGELSPDAVEKMPPHIAFAWMQVFTSQWGFDQLNLHVQMAFIKQLLRMNLDWHTIKVGVGVGVGVRVEDKEREMKGMGDVIKDSEILSNPQAFSAKEHRFFREEICKDRVISIKNADDLQGIMKYIGEGTQPPVFKINYKIESNMDELRQFYQNNPVYCLLCESDLLENLNKTSSPLPKFGSILDVFVKVNILKMTRAELFASHEILNNSPWALDYTSKQDQVALLRRFDELKFKKISNFTDLFNEIKKDICENPQKYDKDGLSWALGYLIFAQGLIHVENEQELSLLRIAQQKGIDLPLFTCPFTLPKSDVLMEILREKPIYQFLTRDLTTAVVLAKAALPGLQKLISELTPESIGKLTDNEIRAWHRVFGRNASELGLEKMPWGELDGVKQGAFKKRFTLLYLSELI